jgi:hypothetical protein
MKTKDEIMLQFALPMIVGYTVLGILIGAVVGKKLWGWVGAACLAMLLGLAPLVTSFLLFVPIVKLSLR